MATSIDRLQDLDEVWYNDPALKAKVISECERLLRIIGVDDEGIREWHARHAVSVAMSCRRFQVDAEHTGSAKAGLVRFWQIELS